MDIKQLIQDNFSQSIATKQHAQLTMLEPIADAVNLIVAAFQNGKKMLICGNGALKSNALHYQRWL